MGSCVYNVSSCTDCCGENPELELGHTWPNTAENSVTINKRTIWSYRTDIGFCCFSLPLESNFSIMLICCVHPLSVMERPGGYNPTKHDRYTGVDNVLVSFC